MPDSKKIGLWQTIALAVGTMIGASIFSIFGLGARIAGSNLPLVFLISGIISLFVAYSYAMLGKRIISKAGPIEFILRGIGDNLITGSLSFLFWFSYVVSIALFAKGFSGYLLPLIHLPVNAVNTGLGELAVILTFTALGVLGSAAVGKAESFIVLIKLAILGLFVVLGTSSIQVQQITPVLDSKGIDSILNATAIFFLSYMGFGLVTNASENMENPERNVPRAIFISIFVVTLVYISVAAVAVGNLPLPELIKAQDNALAVAAKPFLGDFGYLLVAIGALFSISSAINATLFGGANVAYALAKDGELPRLFQRKVWFGSMEGLYLTAGLGLLFALTFNLNGIAAITSSIFMVIYLFVLAAHWRLRHQYGGNPIIIISGFIIISGIFILLLNYQWQTNRSAFYGTWITIGGSLLVELLYRSFSGRGFISREFLKLEEEAEILKNKILHASSHEPEN